MDMPICLYIYKEKQENSRKTSTSASLTTLQSLTVWIKLDLEKAEGPEIKLPTSVEFRKSERVPEKYLLLLY